MSKITKVSRGMLLSPLHVFDPYAMCILVVGHMPRHSFLEMCIFVVDFDTARSVPSIQARALWFVRLNDGHCNPDYYNIFIIDSSVHSYPYCSLWSVLHHLPRKTDEGGTISVHLSQCHCHQHGNSTTLILLLTDLQKFFSLEGSLLCICSILL